MYLKYHFPGDIILINQLNTNPSRMISGDVNGETIQWIRQNSHRVLAKKTGDGTVTYMELDDTNSNLYAADGTAAATDGSEGDVFVKLPTFYYHGTEGNNVEIKFSKTPFEDSVEWDTNTLIGAYEAYYGDGKLQSRSGIESSFDLSQKEFKSYAQKRGKGYQLVDWQMHCVLGCLFYAMYGNTNSREICGNGETTSNTCGSTNSLGMTDTNAKTNGKNPINFWGLESWWGNKWEVLEEDNIGSTMSTYDPVTKGTRTITIPNYTTFNSYPLFMVFGKYLDMIVRSDDPQINLGYVSGYCDFQYWNNNYSGRTIRRSSYNAPRYNGVSCANAQYESSRDSTGTRLAFRGICTKAESVEAFKALPLEP